MVAEGTVIRKILYVHRKKQIDLRNPRPLDSQKSEWGSGHLDTPLDTPFEALLGFFDPMNG